MIKPLTKNELIKHKKLIIKFISETIMAKDVESIEVLTKMNWSSMMENPIYPRRLLGSRTTIIIDRGSQ